MCHQAWPHNDLLLLKAKEQYLWHTYLWPPIPWHRKAMDKETIKAMATKFSEISAISLLKKHRKFCRCGLTHLDATPIFKKSFRYLWATLSTSRETNNTSYESPIIQLFGARRMRAWHHHGGTTPTSLKSVCYFFFPRSWRPRGLIF